ncbi:MAG TPA: hypothetical protein VFN10_19730 [Thermoanaerobaculia bacterium]|nr:hypothetical protein [Thermoanaerobaculia bacterium]
MAVLLLSLSLVPSASADCWTPRASVPIRSSVLDVAVDGNDLWIATSYGVQLLDRTVEPPRIIATAALPGVTRLVQPAGNGIAYVASGSRIYVVRKAAPHLEVIRFVDAGATINDFLLSTYLFVATTNGLAQFDIFDPLQPHRTSAALPTSSANIGGLALNGSTLYAADNDSSLELFNVSSPSLPQHTGTIETLPRASSVRIANQRIYVSDGQSTDIIAGTTRLARLSVPATSLVTLGNDEHFVAGTDRTLRAVDFAAPGTPAELFEQDLSPNGGSINRIFALQLAGSHLYVASGDIGLLSYDVSLFKQPYAVHGYTLGPKNGVAMNGSTVWLGNSDGGIAERSAASSGVLTAVRTWDPAKVTTVYDFNNGLLTAVNTTVTLWNTTPSTPTATWSATFKTSIIDAKLAGDTAYALLIDGTLWKSVAGAAPVQVDLGNSVNSLLARSGNALVAAEVKDDGTTVLRYFEHGSSNAPQTVIVAGAATGDLAMSGNTVALFTFEGLSLVSFPSGSVTRIPQSTTVIPKDLVFDGTSLLALTDRELLVWDTTTRTLTRRIPLTDDAIALAAANGIAVATSTQGFVSVAYKAASSFPEVRSASTGNRYATKVVAAHDRAYLFTRDGIDIYSTQFGFVPTWLGGVRAAGLVDVAATDAGFFTVASNGTVTSYSRAGAMLASTTISEGNDSRPLAITNVNGALWLSLEKGCTSGACERKTLVLDPNTLATTTTLTGGATDVIAENDRAYALFELPAELRVIDVSDPLHPSAIVTSALTAKAVSVAHSGSTVYVLGARLTPYDEATITPGAAMLDTATADATQRVRIEENCAIVTGRTFNPQLFALPSWNAGSTFELPSAVKSIAVQPGRLFILTDHSFEIWSESDAIPAPKRRALH